MKKIWIAKIDTEDDEEYYLAFENEPSENKVKKMFFGEHGHIYEEQDWGNNIDCEIFELNVV